MLDYLFFLLWQICQWEKVLKPCRSSNLKGDNADQILFTYLAMNVCIWKMWFCWHLSISAEEKPMFRIIEESVPVRSLQNPLSEQIWYLIIWTFDHLNIWTLENRNFWTIEHWTIETLEYWNIGYFEHLNTWTFKHFLDLRKIWHQTIWHRTICNALAKVPDSCTKLITGADSWSK